MEMGLTWAASGVADEGVVDVHVRRWDLVAGQDSEGVVVALCRALPKAQEGWRWWPFRTQQNDTGVPPTALAAAGMMGAVEEMVSLACAKPDKVGERVAVATRFLRLGALTKMSAIMQQWPGESKVQLHGCRAIEALLNSVPAAQAALVAYKAANTARRASAVQGRCPCGNHAQRTFCNSCRIVQKSFEAAVAALVAQRAAVEEGVLIEGLLAAVHKEPQAGIRALHSLTHGRCKAQMAEQLRARQGAQTLAQAMVRAGSDLESQEAVCSLVAILARHPQDAEDLFWSGAVKQVAGAMNSAVGGKHAGLSTESLAVSAMDAMQALCRSILSQMRHCLSMQWSTLQGGVAAEQSELAEAVAMSIGMVVVEALEMFPGCVDLQEGGCEILRVLGHSSQDGARHLCEQQAWRRLQDTGRLETGAVGKCRLTLLKNAYGIVVDEYTFECLDIASVTKHHEADTPRHLAQGLRNCSLLAADALSVGALLAGVPGIVPIIESSLCSCDSGVVGAALGLVQAVGPYQEELILGTQLDTIVQAAMGTHSTDVLVQELGNMLQIIRFPVGLSGGAPDQAPVYTKQLDIDVASPVSRRPLGRGDAEAKRFIDNASSGGWTCPVNLCSRIRRSKTIC